MPPRRFCIPAYAATTIRNADTVLAAATARICIAGSARAASADGAARAAAFAHAERNAARAARASAELPRGPAMGDFVQGDGKKNRHDAGEYELLDGVLIHGVGSG
jgi:hypothetical protein